MRRWFDTLKQDLAYGWRSFAKTPGFVAVALLSLTLGIGATSAIFSVIYGVIIDPYPYADAGRIWAPDVSAVSGRGGHTYTPAELRQLQASPAFSSVMATTLEPVLLTGEFAPESFNGVLVTPNAFNFLGVAPAVGRTIQPSDIAANGDAHPVVVISHRLWLRLFEGSPGVVGRTMRLNARQHTIVGVMPPRFGWFTSDGFWLPLSPNRTDIPFLFPIVRLAPGVTAERATEQLHAINRRLAEVRPDSFPKTGFTTNLRNYLDITVASGEMRTSLRLLLGAVGFLLLIACANVANLQLARGVSRAREIAVRMSVGADRRRVLRQLLTESVLLSMVGGALGVLFAFGAIRAIVALMPENYVPNESRVTINLPVLWFSLAVSVVTGIVAGLVPALQASKADTSHVLSAGRSTGAGKHGARTRGVLVVAEVALAVVLLVCASLTVRAFLALQNVDPGLQADRVLLMNVPMAQERYQTREQRNAFARDLLDRLRGLPGVDAVSFGFPGSGRPSTYTIAGQNRDESRRIGVAFAGADHLRTYGIPLRRGRMFDAPEVERGDRVVVINEAAAALWPAGQDPVGTQIRLDMLGQPAPRDRIDTSRGTDVTVVGVMANTRNEGLRSEPRPVAVLPYSVLGAPGLLLAVRAASGDPMHLLNPVRAAVRQMDEEQPLGRPITLSEILDDAVVQPRFTMAMFATFAGLGLVLAAVGIYSVLSFHVSRHTHELGLRMALGAPRRSVLGLMLGMGARLVVAGLVVGALASVGATRLLQNQLFGVRPTDPIAYVAVLAVLGAITFLACYLPARRAAGVDPMVALRED
jgi:putative ABC transport system permease protein